MYRLLEQASSIGLTSLVRLLITHIEGDPSLRQNDEGRYKSIAKIFHYNYALIQANLVRS